MRPRDGTTARLSFVIGKFYPPHRGHHALIDYAASLAQHCIVLVAGNETQFLPVWLRQAWLQKLHPACTIVSDEYESSDIADDDTQAWAARSLRILRELPLLQNLGLDRPDLVVSSETYGEAFALALGCKHRVFDQARELHPVSGTALREFFWPKRSDNSPRPELAKQLDPLVAQATALRFVFRGAESSGKSTLVHELSAALAQQGIRAEVVDEFAREWCLQNFGHAPVGNLQPEDLLHIAKGQVYNEDCITAGFSPPDTWKTPDPGPLPTSPPAPASGGSPPDPRLPEAKPRVILCDTDALCTQVWYERYLPQQLKHPAYMRLSQLAKTHNAVYSEAFLCRPDFDWVQDGTRDSKQWQEWMDQRFEQLDDHISIDGPLAKRIQNALSHIQNRLEAFPWSFNRQLSPGRLH